MRSSGPMTVVAALAVLTRLSDRVCACVVGLVTTFLLAFRASSYGLTWDEPTYFRFARLQRAWFGDLLTAQWGGLFTPARIAEVFLQDRMKNGHPPLHEIWMGLAGTPFTWLGVPDAIAFRLANALLAGGTAALFYLLLRRVFARGVALGGVLAYLGVPCIWAHAHLAATETLQNLIWVAGALVLPRALREGGRWLGAFFAVCALGFFGKFTNLLVPICLLGIAGALGAVRERRFWIAALLGLIAAPLSLLLLDPFFWPWQGGIARFADYLEQVTTRGQWVPLAVYYLGKNWGFSPPWHYRPVELLASLPSLLLVLWLFGLALIARTVPGTLRASWSRPPRIAESAGRAADAVDSAHDFDTDSGRAWLMGVALGAIVLALVIGWMPNAPSHDGTRQFVYVYPAIAIGIAFALDWLRGVRFGRFAPALPAIALAIAILVEPWGLSYRAEWLGGISGAWRSGFELTYWGEAIDGRMLSAVADMKRANGGRPEILSIPKLDFFKDAEDHWRALVPATRGASHPQTLALDAVPAYYERWVTPEMRRQGGIGLRLATPRPLDGVLILFRRSWVQDDMHELLAQLLERGDLRLVAETRVDGVVLAQLFAVIRSQTVTLPGDPTGTQWYVPASLPEILARSDR